MESKLIKDWKGSDVQRMRNIIRKQYNDSTRSQIGYRKKKEDYVEGQIWEEEGKQWTIKDGIKQTITKLDIVRKQASLPILCPCCKNPMKNKLDKNMFFIHAKCFDCVIKYETELKFKNKFEEYKININKQGLKYHLQEMEGVLSELLNNSNTESFVTEDGDIETWKGNNSINEILIGSLKEYINKLKETIEN